jgi:hypothetical protein
VIAAALSAALAVAVALQLPFANGPAEWEWAYRPPRLERWEAPALVAALLVGLAAFAARRERVRGALTATVVLGVLFTFGLVRAQPGGFGRVVEALASRHSFGYLYDAALAPPTGELLADFPEASRHLNQHARTHPAGALLAVRAVDTLGRRLQTLAGGGEPGLVAAAREALERERQRARDRRRPAPASLPSPWTASLLAVLLPALSAAAALPLHALARALGLSPARALTAAALWMLVPARSLFTPSLDQALPLPLVAAAWLAAGDGRVRPAGAGLCLAASCFASYGSLVAVPLVAAVALAGGAGEPATAGRGPNPWRWRAVPWLAAGFLAPWLALGLLAGYDPWASFASAMAEHRAIAVAGRGYLTWLLWNPYDFALLLGPPVVLLALVAAYSRPARPLAAPLAAWWGTLLVLWLSGGVRGEVGRIWLLFMPFACLFAASALERREAPRPGPLLAAAAPEAVLALALAASMTFVG